MLGYFRFDATDIERMEEQKAKEKEYEIMKKQWESFLPQQETNFARWRELRNLVGETKKNNFMLLHCTLFYAEKDVIRTDRDVELFHSVSSPQLKQLQSILKTYIMYNMDLGKDPMYMYVSGKIIKIENSQLFIFGEIWLETMYYSTGTFVRFWSNFKKS